jgi:hypothetical protein
MVSKPTVFSQAQKKLLKSTYQAEKYLGLYRGALGYRRQVEGMGPDYFIQNGHYWYETSALDAWFKTTQAFVSVKA